MSSPSGYKMFRRSSNGERRKKGKKGISRHWFLEVVSWWRHPCRILFWQDYAEWMFNAIMDAMFMFSVQVMAVVDGDNVHPFGHPFGPPSG